MIVVIGAGRAGLPLGWRLGAAGHQVVVLEARDHVGGTAVAPRATDLGVELVHHRLPADLSPPVRSALEQLVPLEVRRADDRIRLSGRWVRSPLTAPGLLRTLPGIAGRSALDAVASPLRRPGDGSYAAVLRARLGPTLWSHLHEPHAWKLWGTDPRRLSGELARRRLASASADAVPVVRPAVRAARRRYLHPRGGFAALAAAMAERVPDIRLGTKVTGLIEHHDRVIVGLADGRIVTASHVFATVAAARTAAWLGLVPAAAARRERAMVVAVMTGAANGTSSTVHHFPERHVLPLRVSEREQGVLCAEIPCWEGDEVWCAADADLALRVRDDLVRSGLPDPNPSDVGVVRLPSVAPVLTHEAVAGREAAVGALAASRRVTVVESHGLLTAADTHEVLATSFAAAERVSAER